MSDVPKALFVQSLGDRDPRVQLQAITGLKRLGAVDAAASILPLTASTDLVIPHVAVEALVALGAPDAALSALTGDKTTPEVANGALRVLQELHNAPTVSGLIDALSRTKTVERRAGILQALARLHYREGVWRGTLAEWWGTRPDTTGPYLRSGRVGGKPSHSIGAPRRSRDDDDRRRAVSIDAGPGAESRSPARRWRRD